MLQISKCDVNSLYYAKKNLVDKKYDFYSHHLCTQISVYLQSILYVYKWSLWWHDLFRQIDFSVAIRWDLTQEPLEGRNSQCKQVVWLWSLMHPGRFMVRTFVIYPQWFNSSSGPLLRVIKRPLSPVCLCTMRCLMKAKTCPKYINGKMYRGICL